MDIPTLYELASKALDKAYVMRCEYLLDEIKDFNHQVPSPIEQEECHIEELIDYMKSNINTSQYTSQYNANKKRRLS